MSGVTQQQIPTFQQGLENQEDSFIARANQQQQFYQPQTPQEQFNQGIAPVFEMRLYRNSFGMTMYIQHINGKPSQPIPAGYYVDASGWLVKEEGNVYLVRKVKRQIVKSIATCTQMKILKAQYMD